LEWGEPLHKESGTFKILEARPEFSGAFENWKMRKEGSEKLPLFVHRFGPFSVTFLKDGTS